MKLIMDGYEIEIKAKNTLTKTRYNDSDTKAVLNRISLALMLSADKQELNEKSYERRVSNDIYKALESVGYYNDL